VVKEIQSRTSRKIGQFINKKPLTFVSGSYSNQKSLILRIRHESSYFGDFGRRLARK
jgi:hypothetical protein